MSGIRKLSSSLALIVLLLAGGSTIAVWLIRTKPAAQRADLGTKPPLVQVRTLAPEDIREVFVGYGSARAEREATLAAEVSGEIVHIPEELKDGSPVDEAQILIRIDDRRYRQQLVRAESILADLQAQSRQLDVEERNIESLMAIARREVDVNQEEHRRLSDLFEKQEASKTEYNFARRAHDRALRDLQVLTNQLELIGPRRTALQAMLQARQAETELARLDVERCEIRAPFSGQVDRFMVEVGDRVMPGSPLLRLIDPDRIEVPVELPVSVYPRTEIGAQCLLEVDSMAGSSWQGKVCRISPVADQRSRTFAAYVEVNNREQQTPLIPGYFLTASVAGPVLSQVLSVPRGAILNDKVFIANNERAHAHTVHVDHVVGEMAIVSGDVAPGQRVILTNLDVLFDGAPVRIEAVASNVDTPPNPSEYEITHVAETSR